MVMVFSEFDIGNAPFTTSITRVVLQMQANSADGDGKAMAGIPLLAGSRSGTRTWSQVLGLCPYRSHAPVSLSYPGRHQEPDPFLK
jgi:hypothetical protein